MNSRELENDLASFSTCSPATIDHTARALREAGLLPVGGRGPHAPQLSSAHVANMLIALGAPRIADVQQFTIDRINMPHARNWAQYDNDEMPGPFAGAKTFGEALKAILEDPHHKHPVAFVIICKDWPYAAIHIKGREDKPHEYGYIRFKVARDSGFHTAPIRSEMRINIGVLQQLAMELAGETGHDAKLIG